MLREYAEISNKWPLIRFLVRGQLKASVHRTALGTVWYSIIPLMQIMVYYFLIVIIFQRGGGFGFDPFLSITMGIMHYMVLNQSSAQGLSSIYSSSSLQLQVKLEPMVLIASGFYKSVRVSLVGVGIFLFLYMAYGPIISYKLLFYPVILIIWLFFCWSFVLFVACAAVYLRDLERITPFVLQLLMYSSPVIYTVGFYPEWLREYILYSPVATIFSLLQWSMIGAPPPSAKHVVSLMVVLVTAFVGANAFYLWCRRGFTKAF